MARLRTSTNLKVHSKLTRREGTQFPPNPYPERGYPISSAYLPGERVPSAVWQLPCSSPLRPWQRPFPFPFSKPLTSAKKNQNPRAAPQ